MQKGSKNDQTEVLDRLNTYALSVQLKIGQITPNKRKKRKQNEKNVNYTKH